MGATPEVSNREIPLALTNDEVKRLTSTVRNLFFGAMPREERLNRIVEALENAERVLKAEKDNPAIQKALFDELSTACAIAEERWARLR